jgi:hypothetical protein
MSTTPQAKSTIEAASAPGDIYRKAIEAEGLVASDDLVALVARLHRATLTGGLIMRAFGSLRQARSKQPQQDAAQPRPNAGVTTS